MCAVFSFSFFCSFLGEDDMRHPFFLLLESCNKYSHSINYEILKLNGGVWSYLLNKSAILGRRGSSPWRSRLSQWTRSGPVRDRIWSARRRQIFSFWVLKLSFWEEGGEGTKIIITKFSDNREKTIATTVVFVLFSIKGWIEKLNNSLHWGLFEKNRRALTYNW